MALNTAKYEAVLNSLTATFKATAVAATPFYPRVCYTHQSQRDTEMFAMLGAMPGVREWIGDRKFEELRAFDFSIKNKLWESSILIPKTSVDDDTYGLYGPTLQLQAVKATYHPDKLLFNTMIANGGTTQIWDNQYFFDSDHSFGDSGSQSNLLTPSAAVTSAVTAAEFRTAFDAARVKMLQYKDDQGEYLNQGTIRKLSNLLILVPPELETAAKTAFQANILSNSSVVVLDMPVIESSAMLTSSTSWYLFNLESPMKPFVFQARQPLTTQYSGYDDIGTKNLKFMTEARYNFGYFAWWNCVKSTFQ